VCKKPLVGINQLISKMNLTYIASVRVPSEKASGLAIMRQCQSFSGSGYDVVLLAPTFRDNITLNAFEYYGISPTFVIKKILSWDFFRSTKIGFYLSRIFQMMTVFFYCVRHHKQIDVVYARDQWMLLAITLFLRKKVTVCEVHTKHRDYISRVVLRRVDKMIVISGGLLTYYTQFLSRTDILQEPSGVNVSQFQNVPKQESLRKSFNIDSEAVVVGYVGKYTTMGQEKGVKELVEAFALAYKFNSKLHLLVAGLEEVEIELVSDLCIKFGLPEGSFSLMELDQSEFASYLMVSDILIINYPDTEHYRYYMSPTKLFAYMASGKQIIASDLDSIREIVDESMVMFVTPDSVQDLSSKIITASNHPYSSVSMSTESLKKVSQYSWENRTSRIINHISHKSEL